jgi:CO/xanthine dehydrogenase FAD-binding subunit
MGMLINLQTIHRPETVEEASSLLKRLGVYPIYGAGAYLVRSANSDVQGAVDLSRAVNDRIGTIAGIPWIGGCATLETIAASDPRLGDIVRAETPNTLRNALTLGDLLMTCPANSLLLATLFGLDTQIVCAFEPPIPIAEWLGMGLETWSQRLILRAELPRYARERGVRHMALAMEKVGRTPADAPIVGAVGFADVRHPDAPPYAVVVGLADRPVRYVEGMPSQVSDYKGSAEYRAEMARILSAQAIARAVAIARADATA